MLISAEVFFFDRTRARWGRETRQGQANVKQQKRIKKEEDDEGAAPEMARKAVSG